ncbi:MAG: aromatic amino acid hydroxylase [Bdellovibrionaceae bacterium]|nr:aromatic amino acid hydroxylase [Pseudobdellovibrionaceae bacterium]
MENLPQHLRKYIVEQDYSKYTPIDHAVWRFILRQLKKFLKVNAHECYLEGLEKTGITEDRIPSIAELSKNLEKFGWRALPVSGFIPPAAFMELQSLSVLPIASDMRSLEHLLYTPAPDIVHEAAGHAPILIHPEFSNYLKKYAQVAKKALISKEDLELYEAIRILSDIKENPHSNSEQIMEAEENLKFKSKSITHVSEASLLSRMNWWTAEYGLIGSLDKPKIFGAGLLSSVGESKWCLSDAVKKIPLSLDCLNYSYDITEPQPQLFVTPNFQTLTLVLEQMAKLGVLKD